MQPPASIALVGLLAILAACGDAPALASLTSGVIETPDGSSTGADYDTTGTDTEPPDSETGTGPDANAEGAGTDSGDSTGTTTAGSTTHPDATTSSTGDTTTTDMEPFCGDGVVNQDIEECDDGSPSADGPCSPLCQRERIIFVLSLKLNGKLSGLQGADAYCRSQASKAQKADPTSPIKDAKNFKALLPSSTETIFERHFRGEGRYRLINGLTVAYSFNRLFSEPLQVAINVTEFGETHNTSVWTASTADGQPYPGIDFCGDWSGVKGSASWGVSDHTDAEWIEVPDEIVQQPTEHCLGNKALYCVEQ